MKTFLKPLKGSEEKKYLDELANGSVEAREQLILHNMRLVAHVVRKYAQTESSAEDLISIGTIGLIKAVDSFDAKRASRLGTYAAKCIDNAIRVRWQLIGLNGMSRDGFEKANPLPNRKIDFFKIP